jgi:hypothetical protein
MIHHGDILRLHLDGAEFSAQTIMDISPGWPISQTNHPKLVTKASLKL